MFGRLALSCIVSAFIFIISSVMNSNVSPSSRVVRQGVRPDARKRAAIVASKIVSARRMMAAFGRPMKF